MNWVLVLIINGYQPQGQYKHYHECQFAKAQLLATRQGVTKDNVICAKIINQTE